MSELSQERLAGLQEIMATVAAGARDGTLALSELIYVLERFVAADNYEVAAMMYRYWHKHCGVAKSSFLGADRERFDFVLAKIRTHYPNLPDYVFQQTLSPSDVHATLRAEFFPDPGFAGVMVDVGAARPVLLSNSLGYRELGWKIVSIEPNPVFCEEHREMGFEILEYACADEDRDDVDFTIVDMTGQGYRGAPITYEAGSSLQLPGYYEKSIEDQQEESGRVFERNTSKVKVRKLDSILAQHAPTIREIDVLSIVVGEWELSVLAGLSLDRYRPKIILADNVAGDDSRANYLLPRGYWQWKKLTPKEIYVRSDWRPAK